MQDMYKIRSAIIHGDEPSFNKNTFNDIYEVTSRASDLLRESIKIFLSKEIDSQDKHSDFITRLDLD